MKYKPTPLSIVPVDKIPEAKDTPTDDPLAIFRVVTQMEKLCTDLNGIGLSAVQVGVPWKLFIVRRDVHYEYYLNCAYVGQGQQGTSIEGCLSLRDADGNLRRFEVERWEAALVKGKRLKVSDTPSLVIEEFSQVERELYAVVFQHEIDHQNGILISDVGKELEIS